MKQSLWKIVLTWALPASLILISVTAKQSCDFLTDAVSDFVKHIFA